MALRKASEISTSNFNPLQDDDLSDSTKKEILFWSRKLKVSPFELFELSQKELEDHLRTVLSEDISDDKQTHYNHLDKPNEIKKFLVNTARPELRLQGGAGHRRSVWDILSAAAYEIEQLYTVPKIRQNNNASNLTNRVTYSQTPTKEPIQFLPKDCIEKTTAPEVQYQLDFSPTPFSHIKNFSSYINERSIDHSSENTLHRNRKRQDKEFPGETTSFRDCSGVLDKPRTQGGIHVSSYFPNTRHLGTNLNNNDQVGNNQTSLTFLPTHAPQSTILDSVRHYNGLVPEQPKTRRCCPNPSILAVQPHSKISEAGNLSNENPIPSQPTPQSNINPIPRGKKSWSQPMAQKKNVYSTAFAEEMHIINSSTENPSSKLNIGNKGESWFRSMALQPNFAITPVSDTIHIPDSSNKNDSGRSKNRKGYIPWVQPISPQATFSVTPISQTINIPDSFCKNYGTNSTTSNAAHIRDTESKNISFLPNPALGLTPNRNLRDDQAATFRNFTDYSLEYSVSGMAESIESITVENFNDDACQVRACLSTYSGPNNEEENIPNEK